MSVIMNPDDLLFAANVCKAAAEGGGGAGEFLLLFSDDACSRSVGDCEDDAGDVGGD